MPKVNKKVIGKKSYESGKIAEKLAKRKYENNGGLVFKIKEAGKQTKTGKFFRENQLCDFIVFNKENDNNVNLVDVKVLPKKKLTISFFNQRKKLKNGKFQDSSTKRQYDNFLKINDFCDGYIGFFHFVDIEKDAHHAVFPINKEKFHIVSLDDE